MKEFDAVKFFLRSRCARGRSSNLSILDTVGCPFLLVENGEPEHSRKRIRLYRILFALLAAREFEFSLPSN